MLAYNMGGKFEVPARKKKICRLVIRDGLLAMLEVLFGGLAIRDDTAEVVSCSAAAVRGCSLYCHRE